MNEDEVLVFLRENNAIEGVYDGQSLDHALEAWNYLMAQDELNQAVVLETHRILMRSQPKLTPEQIGAFRQCRAWVSGKEMAGWRLIQPMMLTWCLHTMQEHKPVDAVMMHVEYERIHPFADGNGRTGRMFMNWTRLKRNNEPLLIFHASERAEYYKLFKRA